MKGVLFTGGAAPEYRYIKDEVKDADIIVAADYGFDTAIKMGVNPDIVIGDMDSIKHFDMLKEYSPDRVLR
ncbi:MAG: thiamine diphosphokinase, partial [Spirochaetales bacterium]|nr:thiamine diphosphokinase [Spirochaetales bacterium]